MAKIHVKKGDLVQVIAGNHKGQKGKVKTVYPKTGRVKVEGLAMVFKHQRVDRQNNTGGRIQEEGTIHVSNVMLVDNSTGKPARTKSEVRDGKKTKVFVKSGNPVA